MKTTRIFYGRRVMGLMGALMMMLGLMSGDAWAVGTVVSAESVDGLLDTRSGTVVSAESGNGYLDTRDVGVVVSAESGNGALDTRDVVITGQPSGGSSRTRAPPTVAGCSGRG